MSSPVQPQSYSIPSRDCGKIRPRGRRLPVTADLWRRWRIHRPKGFDREMRETSDLGKPTETITLPDSVRDQFVETAKTLKARSTIIWGEHCTECAFPSCYSSCAFYTPRDD